MTEYKLYDYYFHANKIQQIIDKHLNGNYLSHNFNPKKPQVISFYPHFFLKSIDVAKLDYSEDMDNLLEQFEQHIVSYIILGLYERKLY